MRLNEILTTKKKNSENILVEANSYQFPKERILLTVEENKQYFKLSDIHLIMFRKGENFKVVPVLINHACTRYKNLLTDEIFDGNSFDCFKNLVRDFEEKNEGFKEYVAYKHTMAYITQEFGLYAERTNHLDYFQEATKYLNTIIKRDILDTQCLKSLISNLESFATSSVAFNEVFDAHQENAKEELNVKIKEAREF